MLINISNHPSSEWSDMQAKIAREQFGEIYDMDHPVISPHDDADSIQQKAQNVLTDILQKMPDAVHVMGEHTFCYSLVALLQNAGIRCLASTTNRSVVRLNESEIRRSFSFNRFRDYPVISKK